MTNTMTHRAPTQEGAVDTTRSTELSETRDMERFLIPPVDIAETDEGLTVLVDLPGVPKEGVDISVEGGVLAIEGRVDKTETSGDTLWREFSLQSFRREFRLGSSVDRGRITARLENGVLEIRLPKAEEARPRKIDVQVVGG